VINAGVVGYELGQEYLFYKDRQWRWQPDLVLLALFLNDLPGNSELEITWSADGLPLGYRRSAAAQEKKESETPHGIGGVTSAWLRSHSLLYVLARKRLETLVAGRARPPAAPSDTEGIANAPWLTALRARADGATAVQWERTYRMLDALSDLVKSQGARLAVIVIPAPIQASQPAWQRWAASMPDPGAFERRKPGEMVLAWCSRNGTPCLDLLETFEKQDPSVVFLRHDRHWTAQGHLVAAGAVGEFLAAHHLP
jgi:acetyltransferase AlgX (SGNH hydrolase-like protein)